MMKELHSESIDTFLNRVTEGFGEITPTVESELDELNSELRYQLLLDFWKQNFVGKKLGNVKYEARRFSLEFPEWIRNTVIYYTEIPTDVCQQIAKVTSGINYDDAMISCNRQISERERLMETYSKGSEDYLRNENQIAGWQFLNSVISEASNSNGQYQPD